MMRAAVLGALLLSPGIAHADEDLGETSVLFMGGLNIGATHIPGSTGFTLGGEVSLPVVHFKDGCYFACEHDHYFGLPGWPSWLGLYADYTRDFGTDTSFYTFGPEIGYGPLGIDGGLAWANGHTGWAVRPVLTLGFIAVYGRVDRIEGETVSQFGVLLKYGKKLLVK